MPDTDSWQLRDGEQVIAGNEGLLGRRHFLIGITRVRNEALGISDTLDYVGSQVDAIIAYDDASTDRTLEILRKHPKVALIVVTGRGKPTSRPPVAEAGIAGCCCRRRANISNSTGCSASMRTSA